MIKSDQINTTLKVNHEKYTALHGITAVNPEMDKENNIPLITEGIYYSVVIDRVKRDKKAAERGTGDGIPLKVILDQSSKEFHELVIAKIQTEDIDIANKWIDFINTTFN